VVTNFKNLYQGFDDLLTLEEMAKEENDPELEKEAQAEADKLSHDLERLEIERMFSGPNDNDPCYMDIQSGSGGTEAQDWAEMVMRMYMKFGEKHGFNVTVTELSEGEVAGIKSATLRFEGDHAYGLEPKPAFTVWLENHLLILIIADIHHSVLLMSILKLMTTLKFPSIQLT